MPQLWLLLLQFAVTLAADPSQWRRTVHLEDSNFDQVTQAATGQGSGIWAVKFCSPQSEHCRNLQPVWDLLAEELAEENINLAEVDTALNPSLSRRFGILTYDPIMVLFRDQQMYVYPLGTTASLSQMSTAFRPWVLHGYAAGPAYPVPPESELEQLWRELKAMMFTFQGAWIILMSLLGALGITVTFIITVNRQQAAAAAAAAVAEMKRYD